MASTNRHEENGINREKKNYIWVSRVHSSLLLAFKRLSNPMSISAKITTVLLLDWAPQLKAFFQVYTYSLHLADSFTYHNLARPEKQQLKNLNG